MFSTNTPVSALRLKDKLFSPYSSDNQENCSSNNNNNNNNSSISKLPPLEYVISSSTGIQGCNESLKSSKKLNWAWRNSPRMKTNTPRGDKIFQFDMKLLQSDNQHNNKSKTKEIVNTT